MPPKLHLLVLLGKRVDVILAGKMKNGWNFFAAWNWKNWWQESIPKQWERVPNWQEQVLRQKKRNFDQNSGGEKVPNWINRGILQNSKWISQPSLQVQRPRRGRSSNLIFSLTFCTQGRFGCEEERSWPATIGMNKKGTMMEDQFKKYIAMPSVHFTHKWRTLQANASC